MTAVCSVSIAAYVEAVAGVFDISRGHVVPQVALRCGFLNKYKDLRTGEWVNGDIPSPCDISKNAILDYCRQVYGDLDVNNIEDSNEDSEIRNWCPMDAPDIPDGCVETFTIPTYTCLVGDFESKALMVPKDCDFEHIHDSETCKPKSELHSQAEKQCAAAGKTVRDFGMLLPCRDEVDLFTGVEFVCCPKQTTTPKKVGKPDTPKVTEPVPPKVQEPEEPKPEVEPAEPATEQEPVTEPLPEDPYFKESFEADEEHDAFVMAKERLEDKEEDKRTQVMQQWEEAQAQYETLRKSDPKGAEAMKKGMMERFDNTMADLEVAAQREHEQLRNVHQQRVGATLREQRTHAERLFTEALREEPPRTKKILHLFQKFLKAVQRDRQHHINIYKHLLTTDPARAQKQRRETVQHLHDMDSSVQSCFDMITKMTDIYSEIKSKVDTLLNSSQSPEDIAFLKSMEIALRMETPKEKDVVEETEEPEEPKVETEDEEVVDAPTPAPPKKTAVVPKKSAPEKPSKLPKAPIVAKILPPKGKAPSGRKVPQVPDFPMIVAKITPEEPEVAVKGEALPMVKIVKAEAPSDKATGEQPEALVEEEISPAAHIPIIAVQPLDHYLDNENEDDVSVSEDTEEPSTPAKALKPILVAKKQPQKSQKAAASKVDKSPEFRPQASSRIDNSVTQKSIKYGATPALAFGLACGVLAVATVMVVAVVLVRRKTRRVPVNHGFTEIDPNMTVEQRHIAAMQANGYENSTYKYFEMQ